MAARFAACGRSTAAVARRSGAWRGMRPRCRSCPAGIAAAGPVRVAARGGTGRPGAGAGQPDRAGGARLSQRRSRSASPRSAPGAPAHPTPTGVFTILQKARVHHSSTYDEASMPFTERLTWDGVALHAGGVPGYPSSHGCVHLPLDFAQLLFGVTKVGTTVVIADAHSAPQRSRASGADRCRRPSAAADSGSYVWAARAVAAGPLSLLVSIADRRCYAYRNGIEIGSAAATFARPEEPLLPGVFVLLDRSPATASRSGREVGLFGPARPRQRSDALDRITLPPGFARRSRRCWCRAPRCTARSARQHRTPHRPRLHRALRRSRREPAPPARHQRRRLRCVAPGRPMRPGRGADRGAQRPSA